MNIRFFIIKAINKILRLDGKKSCERINSYFRKKGIEIGNNCRIYSDILSSEPYLISIGDNVTISNDVQFVTHDNSIIKVSSDSTDLFGKITIGNNCFVGAHAVLLAGVTVGDNCIIGAGSVVANSIPDGYIVAGNPAKIISDVNIFENRYHCCAFNIDGLSSEQKQSLILSDKKKWISRKMLADNRRG